MRKEATIRQKMDNMRSSPYAEHNMVEIGMLMWILGEAQTPRQGTIIERERQRELREPKS